MDWDGTHSVQDLAERLVEEALGSIAAMLASSMLPLKAYQSSPHPAWASLGLLPQLDALVSNYCKAEFWRDQLAGALGISFAAKQSSSIPAWGTGVLGSPLSTISKPFRDLRKYNLVSLHVTIPACLIRFISVLKPASGASSSAQLAGAPQINLAHAPWTYDYLCPMHTACLKYQREVFQYLRRRAFRH